MAKTTGSVIPAKNASGNRVGSVGLATLKWLAGYFDNLYGKLTGDVVGNLTGNVTGNVKGNVEGDVKGNLDGNAKTATNATNATNADKVGNKTVDELISEAQEGITSGNTVAVLTGTFSIDVRDSGGENFIMPLPSGFTENQCHFFGVVVRTNVKNYRLVTVSRITRVTGELDAGLVPYIMYYKVIGVKE